MWLDLVFYFYVTADEILPYFPTVLWQRYVLHLSSMSHLSPSYCFDRIRSPKLRNERHYSAGPTFFIHFTTHFTTHVVMMIMSLPIVMMIYWLFQCKILLCHSFSHGAMMMVSITKMLFLILHAYAMRTWRWDWYLRYNSYSYLSAVRDCMNPYIKIRVLKE